MGEISIPIAEALPTTEISKIHLMAIHCVAAEHGSWIKIKARPVTRGVLGGS